MERSERRNGLSGLVFNYVVRNEKRLDEVIGYGGTLADPDGYIAPRCPSV